MRAFDFVGVCREMLKEENREFSSKMLILSVRCCSEYINKFIGSPKFAESKCSLENSPEVELGRMGSPYTGWRSHCH